jgi:hypothetical protein
MLREMANIAAECIKHPARYSVWLPAEGRYVCPETPAGRREVELIAARQETEKSAAEKTAAPRRLNPAFKLVFLTAGIGTAGFMLLCVGLTIYLGKERHEPLEKLIAGILDLVKIGFGAIVGMLGGQSLQARERAAEG